VLSRPLRLSWDPQARGHRWTRRKPFGAESWLLDPKGKRLLLKVTHHRVLLD
jgi:hypothetical protein